MAMGDCVMVEIPKGGAYPGVAIANADGRV